jgi:hypothetical protein
MDPTDISGILELTPSPSGDAIQQIVQVFEDGCRAAAALRHTVDDLSAPELRSELNSIERGMLRQIATICERYNRSTPPPPTGGNTVTPYDLVGDCLGDLPPLPRN